MLYFKKQPLNLILVILGSILCSTCGHPENSNLKTNNVNVNVKQAIFYGNLGSWGSLGWDHDRDKILSAYQQISYDKIVENFNNYCAMAQIAALQALQCKADLIAYTAGGSGGTIPLVADSERVARAIYNAGGGVNLHFAYGPMASNRTMNAKAMLNLTENVFLGATEKFSTDFFETYPVGLSIDMEHLTRAPKPGRPHAVEVNAICEKYFAIMTDKYHHPKEKLFCGIYDFTYFPFNIGKAEELAKNIVVINDSFGNINVKLKSFHMIADAYGYNLAGKFDKPYAYRPYGCMFFDRAFAPYLYNKQRDFIGAKDLGFADIFNPDIQSSKGKILKTNLEVLKQYQSFVKTNCDIFAFQ